MITHLIVFIIILIVIIFINVVILILSIDVLLPGLLLVDFGVVLAVVNLR
jgi:hypothetical protein